MAFFVNIIIVPLLKLKILNTKRKMFCPNCLNLFRQDFRMSQSHNCKPGNYKFGTPIPYTEVTHNYSRNIEGTFNLFKNTL